MNQQNTSIYKPLVLLILDGWGYAPSWGGNAITQAKIPNFNHFWRDYPHTTLGASGNFVGLPGHEQGNSEVGHLNIGSGRIVYQDSSKINKAISDGSFYSNQVFIDAINHAKKNQSKLHLMGLVSDGGVHSQLAHLLALLKIAQDQNFKEIYIHAFTDGRDTAPMSGLQYINQLEKECTNFGVGKIATVMGRYWAMDRDNHWDRIKLAYQAMVSGKGLNFDSALKAVSESYKQSRFDEFIVPSIIVDKDNQPIAKVSENDSLIFFNFRSDRARQITKAFCTNNFKEFDRGEKIDNLFFVSMIPYGFEIELNLDIKSAFQSFDIKNGLSEVISNQGLKQFHIAETEKYAHVTYFFNGGVEKPFSGEDRLMIPSPKVATYDLAPEMSVKEITDNILKRLDQKIYQLMVVNFANPDMVGHTGNLKATIDACEEVDLNIGKIYQKIKELNGILLITADHGNAEEMIDPQTGQINTEHSCNPVPFILISDLPIKILKSNGILADVAPTILRLLAIQKPAEMTGEPLYS